MWLKGENGENPPALWEKLVDGEEFSTTKLSDFGGSLISGSSKDMHCQIHSTFEKECTNCKKLKALVDKFQGHRHTFTCKKKGKVIRILAGEGHGRKDGERETEMLLVPVCRFNHPKNPIDKTEFLMAFPENHDELELKKAKSDYSKIRKFLLRLTYGSNFDKEDRWKKFKELNFYEYLFEVGMFDKGKEPSDKDAREKARKRYLSALRCEVKST